MNFNNPIHEISTQKKSLVPVLESGLMFCMHQRLEKTFEIDYTKFFNLCDAHLLINPIMPGNDILYLGIWDFVIDLDFKNGGARLWGA